MASVNVVAIPSQDNYVTFDDLRLGRSSQQIVGRLLRFWDARNIKKDGQFLGIVLLLQNEKSSTIHGFIPAARANDYRDVLHEGLIFKANGAADSDIPGCLEELAGKTFIFQLKVTSFNFTPKHRTFTVSTMTPLEPEDGIIPVGNPPNGVHNGALPDHNGPPTAQLGAPNFEVGDGSKTEHSDVGPVVNPRKRARE
ncbi:hypothetical protein AALP_AA3G279600 [Arabis alpina]|uniref:DUF223 domain-containing protein n=1 Tax=Arabis alpina TaxID=50452 RepID=A0A087HC65_ARAAL|nr:hypothetical protein AALP_AA3G279600 [Arabis alpina]